MYKLFFTLLLLSLCSDCIAQTRYDSVGLNLGASVRRGILETTADANGMIVIDTALNVAFPDTTSFRANIGKGQLVSGIDTVFTLFVKTNSFIFVSQSSSTITNVGTLTAGSIATGHFVVRSTNVSDTSFFNWHIINP